MKEKNNYVSGIALPQGMFKALFPKYEIRLYKPIDDQHIRNNNEKQIDNDKVLLAQLKALLKEQKKEADKQKKLSGKVDNDVILEIVRLKHEIKKLEKS
ncbi:hypothetical protein GMMP15_1600002 [Candidatus Magnetomoraceae bacterium gMMP-15]